MTHNAQHVIIHSIAESEPVTPQDKAELLFIGERSTDGCSFSDALTVVRILWKYLRP